METKLSEFNQNLKTALVMSNKNPYMSINRLAEYLDANSFRRKSIVKNMKADKDFMKAYYQPVYAIIPRYIRNGLDSALLKNAYKKLEAKDPDGTWETRDRKNSLLALKALQDIELPDFSDYDFVTDVEKLDKVELSGVTVGIKPELYLRNKYSDKIGALKSSIQKTEESHLTEKSRQYAATLIKWAFIEYGYEEKEIDNNACISLDVFAKGYSVAPGAYKQKVKDLESACQEIALWWNVL